MIRLITERIFNVAGIINISTQHQYYNLREKGIWEYIFLKVNIEKKRVTVKQKL